VPGGILIAGLLVFFLASLACSLAGSLPFLIAARCVQGAGAALLLAGALPVLGDLAGSVTRGAAIWTLAGTFGLALGPALGGVLTQLFDWRAIFAVQAPVRCGRSDRRARRPKRGGAGGGLAARHSSAPGRRMPASVCCSEPLVGVLFLSVLLLITVWGYSPIAGAAIVSVLPAATVLARPLRRRLGGPCGDLRWRGAHGRRSYGARATSLGEPPGTRERRLCFVGIGLGLAVPALSEAALDPAAGLARSGTFTVGVRHLGLVLALALIAPLLASRLPAAGDQAKLRATSVLLDAPLGLTTKVPVALDLANEFERARSGEIPDLAKPFDAHGRAAIQSSRPRATPWSARSKRRSHAPFGLHSRSRRRSQLSRWRWPVLFGRRVLE
jgi:MFS family permease